MDVLKVFSVDRWEDTPGLNDICSLDSKASFALSRSFLESLSRHHHRIVTIERDHCLLGFSLVLVYEQGDHLIRIVVDPAFQGQGIGGQLLDRTLKEGKQSVFLEVAMGNAAAIALYRRRGFEFAGEIRQFYSNGESAHRMVLTR